MQNTKAKGKSKKAKVKKILRNIGQITYHRFQIPNRFKVLNSIFYQDDAVEAIGLYLGHLVIGFLCLFGAWCLRFGIFFSLLFTFAFCLLPLTFSSRVTRHALRITSHV